MALGVCGNMLEIGNQGYLSHRPLRLRGAPQGYFLRGAWIGGLPQPCLEMPVFIGFPPGIALDRQLVRLPGVLCWRALIKLSAKLHNL